MKKLPAVLASLALLFPAALVVESASSIPTPVTTCAPIVGKGIPYSLLVVGESWATGAKLFPNLPESLAKRLPGRAIKVCAMGFSGKNTQKILRGATEQVSKGTLTKLFPGTGADSVVILNGINDQVQHVGAKRYAEGTAKLARLFDGSTVQVVAAPTVKPYAADNLSFVVAQKSRLYRLVHDQGKENVTRRYRDELHKRHPEVHVIDFDAFLSGYSDAEYTPDGLHLRATGFRRYGDFLGGQLDLPGSVTASSGQSQNARP